jgi:ABC-type nitrate/sulfonate/bicarbonate transport system substrate-binding protein
MRKTVIGIFTLFFLILASSPALPQLKKIRFSTTSIAVTEMQFRIAHLKGFYREEGLDLETLLIRGSVGMQALIGGSVDYASAAGSIIAAAVRGAPVRLVLIVNSKPQFDLVGRPDIKSVRQLKGKVVGISSRGGAVGLLTQLILTHHGVTPNKDATLIVIGTPEELATALRTGHIAACLLGSAETVDPILRRLQQARLFRRLPCQLSIGGHRGNGGKDQNQSIRSPRLCQSESQGTSILYAQSRRLR